MADLVSFELNNWFSGRDYPPDEPFRSWVSHYAFSDDAWCKQNKLVVLSGNIDMSANWCVTATREWVEQNCPDLLSTKTYQYKTIISSYDEALGKVVGKEILHDGSYAQFIRYPDEDGNVYGQFGWDFPEYCEENFGVHYYEEDDE